MIRLLVWITVLAGVGAGVWYATRDVFSREVIVAPAERGVAVNAVTGTVEVYAGADLKVTNEVPGRIREFAVEVGDYVRQGDDLVYLDSKDLQFRLEQSRVQLEAMKRREALPIPFSYDIQSAEEALDILRERVDLEMASEQELRVKEREVEKTRVGRDYEEIDRWERINLLELQVQQLEHQIERMTVKAPFDGKIVQITSVPGDYVFNGTNLMRLISDERVIIMTLSEEDFSGVAKDQRVVLRLAAYPNRPLNALVDFMATTADSKSKTRDVYLRVAPDEDASLLVPGITGEGVLFKAEREDTIIIPRRGLIGNTVYVLENGVVKVKQVTPGFRGVNQAEVFEGLNEGELVILEDQAILRTGDAVSVADES